MGLNDILSFLGGLFGSGGAASGGDTAAAFTALQTEVCGIGQALAFSDSFVGSWLSSIHSFLSKIWEWMLQHFLWRLIYWAEVAERWIKYYASIFYHIVRDVVILIQWYFKQFFGPILQLISVIRKILTILKLFHVGFAIRLDSYLAQIQRDITQAFQKVVGTINHLASYIDLMLLPSGLFNSNILLGSLARDCQSLFAIQWGWNQTPLAGAPATAFQTLAPAIQQGNVQSDASSAMQGNIPDYYQSAIEQASGAWGDLGFNPLVRLKVRR